MAVKRFTPEVLDQIRERVSLTEVIRASNVTGWKRKGNEWWACCPFHHEKSPSFHIREDQGYYHCFGCGAHGTAFDFVKEMRGGSFVEGVEYLASLAGVVLEEEEIDPKAAKKRTDGLSALAQAAAFYQQNLQGESKRYVVGRGLDDETITTFSIGFAPDSWDGVSSYLAKQGMTPKTLEETGLTSSSQNGKKVFDRFRNRIMFPIENMKNEVIGFGGRIFGEGDPKYLNSPETSYFNKRYQLYNLNRAKEYIYKQKQALIVEGYMDVIGLWQQGVRTAVAPMGTAITEDQVKVLWRYQTSPIVCMDGDDAGRMAAVRIAKRILAVLEPGKTLRFAWMPQGEDPDSFVSKEGKEAFDKLLSETSSIEDVIWQDVIAGRDLKAADDRAEVETNIKQLMMTVQNDTMQKNYRQTLLDRMWQHGRNKKTAQKIKKTQVPTGEQARKLLSILYRKPELMDVCSEKLSNVCFEKQAFNDLKDILFRLFMEGGVEKEKLDTYLETTGMQATLEKALQSDLIDRAKDSDLERLWLEIYDALGTGTEQQVGRSNREVMTNLTRDFTEESWKELKRLRKKRVANDNLKYEDEQNV